MYCNWRLSRRRGDVRSFGQRARQEGGNLPSSIECGFIQLCPSCGGLAFYLPSASGFCKSLHASIIDV